MKAPSFLLPFDISFLLHSTRGNKFSNNKFLEYICIYIYIIAERVLIGIENNVNVCSEKKPRFIRAHPPRNLSRSLTARNLPGCFPSTQGMRRGIGVEFFPLPPVFTLVQPRAPRTSWFLFL